ncbi:MAG: hypothetical protein KA144_12815, partial [Xanthomonadaceae bacterium]|nr:hypothetical protein [Xanthomonadaceae bacterium]
GIFVELATKTDVGQVTEFDHARAMMGERVSHICRSKRIARGKADAMRSGGNSAGIGIAAELFV